MQQPRYSPDGMPVEGAGEREPLMAPRRGRSGKAAAAAGASRWHHYEHLAEGFLLQFGPTALLVWFAFLGSSLLATFLYHHLHILVIILTAAGCVFALGGAVSSFRAGSTDRALAMVVVFAAVSSGFLVGFYNYSTNVHDYWSYSERRHYKNVLPDEPAAAHEDAVVLEFASDAAPDLRHAASYGSGRAAYCVAPVTGGAVQDAAAAGAGVQFWAVGRGCCGGGGFSCGDARYKSARSGLVLQNRTHTFSGYASRDLDYYMEAVDMACAKFGLASARPPLLMYWVEDPAKWRGIYLQQAWWLWFKAGLLTLPIWVLLSIDVNGLRNLGPGKLPV